MHDYINRGMSCGKLVPLLCWLIWNISSPGNVAFRSVSASSSNVNSTGALQSSRELNSPGKAGESNAVSPALTTTTSNREVFEEEFPLWIIVLIVVTGGLLMVACMLCLIKFHRWKKDHGTYSMWNKQGPSVEAMFAKESSVLFEIPDIDTSTVEAQCYEIPTDSFETPQRIYVDGVRIIPLLETSETPMSQRALPQADADTNIIDQTEYCLAKDSVSTVDTCQRGSLPSSIGPAANPSNGKLRKKCVSPVPRMSSESETKPLGKSKITDTSQRSSVAMSSASDKGPMTPSRDIPKEVYPKPLPIVPVEDTPPVLCETYTLDLNANEGRVTAIAKRPLPLTPHFSTPPVKYSAASLDRNILKQQKEEKLNKPSTFRTLPRPRKIRQIPLPFLNAISRSASSSDVSKESPRGLSDHVACDPTKCTLTRIKKRMSRSVGSLLAPEYACHFYENPYLGEGTAMETERAGKKKGTHLEPPYSRASSIPGGSDENLPKDKDHLYTRISEYMDGRDYNLNRHSYASVHYPSFRSRPKSRHVYISVIFGSADSVKIPSLDKQPRPNADTAKRTRALSKSCPTFFSSYQHYDLSVKHTQRPNSLYSPTDTSGGLHAVDTRNVRGSKVSPNAVTNDLTSFSDTRYQNIRDSLGLPPLLMPVPSNGYRNSQEEIYKSPKSVQLYYENVPNVMGNTRIEDERGSGIDPGHYGVPKSPPIPLNRFCEILKTTSGGSHLQTANRNVPSKGDGNLEIWKRKRNAENGNHRTKNGERKTLSAYLERRFEGGEFNESDKTDRSETSGIVNCCNEPAYENFISTNGNSCISEKSVSSHDRASLGSSLSIDDREIFENQPLIPKTSDVNGNSVCEGFVERLEVRRKSLTGDTLFGESVA